MPDQTPDTPDTDRGKRFVDDSADHVKVGPKTAEALQTPKTMEELDALIPVAEDDEDQDGEEK
jgi:hypothetical protein